SNVAGFCRVVWRPLPPEGVEGFCREERDRWRDTSKGRRHEPGVFRGTRKPERHLAAVPHDLEGERRGEHRQALKPPNRDRTSEAASARDVDQELLRERVPEEAL